MPLRAAGDRASEANTLNFVAEVYYYLSKYQKALDTYEQALPLWWVVGDPNGEGWTLSNMGAVSFGEKEKALDYYPQALLVYQSISDPRGQGITFTGSGGVYASSGENQKALGYLSPTRSLRRIISDRRGQAYTLNNIGYPKMGVGRGLRRGLLLCPSEGERVYGTQIGQNPNS